MTDRRSTSEKTPPSVKQDPPKKKIYSPFQRFISSTKVKDEKEPQDPNKQEPEAKDQTKQEPAAKDQTKQEPEAKDQKTSDSPVEHVPSVVSILKRRSKIPSKQITDAKGLPIPPRYNALHDVVFLLYIAECLVAVPQAFYYQQLNDYVIEFYQRDYGINDRISLLYSGVFALFLGWMADSYFGIFTVLFSGNILLLAGCLLFGSAPDPTVATTNPHANAVIFLCELIYYIYDSLFPIKIMYILKQVKYHPKLNMLILTSCVFFGIRFASSVAIYYYKTFFYNIKREFNMMVLGMQMLLIVIYNLLLLIFKRALDNSHMSNIVENVAGCAWDSITRFNWSVRAGSHPVTFEGQRWVDRATAYSKTIKDITYNFIPILAILFPFIIYYGIEQLIYSVWLYQMSYLETENVKKVPMYDQVKLALWNLLNIPLIFYVLLPLLRSLKKYLVITDLRLLWICQVILLLSLIFTSIFYLNTLTEKLPERVYGQLRVYNALRIKTTISSTFTGTKNLEFLEVGEFLNLTVKKREVVPILIENPLYSYTRPLILYEEKAVSYIINVHGMTKVEGFDPVVFKNKKTFEDVKAGIVIYTGSPGYSGSIEFINENNDVFKFPLPLWGRKTTGELEGGVYTFQLKRQDGTVVADGREQDINWTLTNKEVHSLLVTFGRGGNLEIVSYSLNKTITFTPDRIFSKRIYLMSFAQSLEVITMSHFIFTESPRLMLATAGAYWYAIRSFGEVFLSDFYYPQTVPQQAFLTIFGSLFFTVYLMFIFGAILYKYKSEINEDQRF